MDFKTFNKKYSNKIGHGNVYKVIQKWPDNCIDCVVTSPPYWALRDYGSQNTQIWDGDPNCKHDWMEIKHPPQGGHTKKSKVGNNKKVQDGTIGSPRFGHETNFCNKCGCYDDQTELLTDKGWIFFKNLTFKHKVATPIDGTLQYVYPDNIFEYDYDGELINFYGQNLDINVTSNHNMWTVKRNHNNFEFILAENIKNGYGIKRTFKWIGKNLQIFNLPINKDIKNRKKNNEEIIINMEDWMEFLGIYLAEGFCRHRKRKSNQTEYAVNITQTKKESRKKIEELLNRLPFNFNYTRDKDYVIYNKSLYFYLKKLGKVYDKYIPEEYKNLSTNLLQKLLDGFILGDGHIRKDDGRKECYTTSKQLADDLQEIILKLNFSSTISAKKDKRQNRKFCYRISIIEKENQKHIAYVRHISKNKYKGKVYCCEVNPSHLLVVRRNGKVSICGNSWRGQLGLEPNPSLFIKHLCDIFDEVRRILKPTGSCWVNFGDTYSSGIKGSGGRGPKSDQWKGSYFNPIRVGCDAPQKSLLMIPERFAWQMIERGWTLRNVIIWHKLNAMPHSAKDRFTGDFEYFYFFTKSKKYFFEQQFEPYTKPLNRWGGNKTKGGDNSEWDKNTGNKTHRERNMRPNDKGRNKRAVWSINTASFKGAHFAVMPLKLVEPPIKSGCPDFVCSKCGKPKEKIWEKKPLPEKYKRYLDGEQGDKKKSGSLIGWTTTNEGHKWRKKNPPIHVGWTECKCDAEVIPGIVFDPFVGSGTVPMLAKQLGKRYIGVDLNPKYVKIAKKRIKNGK